MSSSSRSSSRSVSDEESMTSSSSSNEMISSSSSSSEKVSIQIKQKLETTKKRGKKGHVEIEMDSSDSVGDDQEMFVIDDEGNLERIELEEREMVIGKRRVDVVHSPWRQKWRRYCLCQFMGYKGTLIHVILLYLFLLGLLGGLVGSTMDILINLINDLKELIIKQVDNQWYKIAMSFIFTFIGGTIAFLITKFISPKANGSGVPDMKVLLLGNDFPGFLAFRTLIAKILGLTVAIGSGMWCGKVGPFIHISSCIAYNLSRLPIFRFIHRSPELLNQMLSVAAGCGVAANFGAPMGGLLFSIEATATYYPVRNYWFSTISSIIASITFRVFTNLYRDGPSLFTGLLYVNYSFDVSGGAELLISVVIAIFISFFAVIYTKFVGNLFRLRAVIGRIKIFQNLYVYLFVVLILTGLFTAPWEGTKSPLGYLTNPTLNNLFSDKPINGFLNNKPILPALIVMFLARFVLTSMTIPAPVPCGLFATNLVVGALFGRLFGEFLVAFGWDNNMGPHGCAWMGAACFVSSITQTFSPTMVVMELTDNNQLLMPAFLATTISVSLSRIFNLGIYDEISAARKLPLIPDIQYSVHSNAGTIMDKNIKFVTLNTTIRSLKEFTETMAGEKDIRAIPVVNNADEMILVGQILLKELRNLSKLDLVKEVNEKFKLECKECPIVAVPATEVTEVHMLMIASRTKNCFVVNRGRLVGEISEKRLSEEFDNEVIINI